MAVLSSTGFLYSSDAPLLTARPDQAHLNIYPQDLTLPVPQLKDLFGPLKKKITPTV